MTQSTTTLINGTQIASAQRQEVKTRVDKLKEHGVIPKLAVILVGGHPPSQIYVKYKQKAAKEVGITTTIHQFDESVELTTLYECVDQLNADKQVHGILVQLPLPKHLSNEEMWSVVERVSPQKDVDGLHPSNQGLIAHSYGLSHAPQRGFVACTPLGCLRLLQEYVGNLEGLHAVVVGRSRIVGHPMANLLTKANATVTLCHSRTRDLSKHLKMADIIIAAAGIPKLIKSEDVSEKAVIIDVGIHRLANGKLCGDADFEQLNQKVKAISPVPGGVGPMTIASLMNNVCVAAERTLK